MSKKSQKNIAEKIYYNYILYRCPFLTLWKSVFYLRAIGKTWFQEERRQSNFELGSFFRPYLATVLDWTWKSYWVVDYPRPDTRKSRSQKKRNLVGNQTQLFVYNHVKTSKECFRRVKEYVKRVIFGSSQEQLWFWFNFCVFILFKIANLSEWWKNYLNCLNNMYAI